MANDIFKVTFPSGKVLELSYTNLKNIIEISSRGGGV